MLRQSDQQCQNDEKYLHRETQPEGCCRLATQGDLLECRVDIRLKHGYKQDSQANAGWGSHLRNQQANGSQDLQETGDKDDLSWIGKRLWHHLEEILFERGKVGAGGKEEHHRQCPKGSVVPGEKQGHSQVPSPRKTSNETNSTSNGIIEIKPPSQEMGTLNR